jgi:hypothetical protein
MSDTPTPAEQSGGTPVATDDFLAIQRLVHRYVDAVVHRDGVRWGDTWADDATWDLGRGRLVEGQGRDRRPLVPGDGGHARRRPGRALR